MIKHIFTICFITILASCSNSPIDKTENKDATIEEIDVSTVVVDNKTSVPVTEVNAEGQVPEYMDLELKGYGVPDINLQDVHGKVVFLNHWGSWCPPCRREMPSVQSLYDKYGDKVEFVMIATEKKPGAHVPYIEKNGFTFPVYSMNSPASTEVKPKGYPTTIIMDKKGAIKTYEVGAADWNSEQVHQFLDELLAE